MKRLLAIVLSLSLAICIPVSVNAEGEDFSDASYWSTLCTSGGLSAEEKTACNAYMQYISTQSSSLQQAMKDLESRQAEIASNIQYYAAQVTEYQTQANAMNDDITSMTQQIVEKQGIIDSMEIQMEELQATIDENQLTIDAAREKIKARIVTQQETMRFNQQLEVLMGAKTFNDFIRIANGLSDISAYDQKTMDDLSELIEELAEDKAEIEVQKAAVEAERAVLDELKQDLVNQQAQLLELMYTAQYYEEQFRLQSAELEAQGNRYAAQIEEIQKQMAEIAERLNEVAASPGWTNPVPSARFSAGTWAYPSGGVHLGEDFAASVGTPVYAVGNGVVINSADGCPYGHLGDTCGYQYGGSTMGGNQVYLLTKINGSLYAVKYLHLLAGTPAAKGTIVAAGQQIGQVGSSGNSSGPHCHIEIFYLGDEKNFTKYAQSWNGDLAFGCGWGSAALSRRCESGVGAPCRIAPETVLGK